MTLSFLIGHKISHRNTVISLSVMFSFHTVQTAATEVKHLLVYLEEHVSRLYSPISSHSSSFHDRANVNAAVSPVITLTNNTDTQKVVLLCQGESRGWVWAGLKTIITVTPIHIYLYSHIQIKINHSYGSVRFTHVERDGDDVEAHGGVRDTAEGWRLEKQEEDTISTQTSEIVKKSHKAWIS